MSQESKFRSSKDPSGIVDSLATLVDLPHVDDVLGRSARAMKTLKLPQILKSLMKQKEISARSLSKSTGVPVATISSYLAGRKATYSPEHLAKLSDFFEISADYLLFGRADLPKNLDLLKTEQLFSGWLKVKVERVVPGDEKGDE